MHGRSTSEGHRNVVRSYPKDGSHPKSRRCLSSFSLSSWLLIFAVIGKQKYLATRAASRGLQWWVPLSIDSQGRAQPYHLLVAFIVAAGILARLFGSSRGRKLTGPWRSWLLVVALAGFLGLVTELMLRF